MELDFRYLIGTVIYASLIGLFRRPSFEQVRNALSGSRYPVCLMARW
jgi:hypothetical protein